MALKIANSRYIKVWEVKEGKFGKEFNLGSSRKIKYPDEYKNSNWWNCRFVAGAKDFGDRLEKGDIIKIVSGQLENVYNKETKKAYFNLVIFEAEYEEGHEKTNDSMLDSNYSSQAPVVDDISEDEFPF